MPDFPRRAGRAAPQHATEDEAGREAGADAEVAEIVGPGEDVTG